MAKNATLEILDYIDKNKTLPIEPEDFLVIANDQWQKLSRIIYDAELFAQKTFFIFNVTIGLEILTAKKPELPESWKFYRQMSYGSLRRFKQAQAHSLFEAACAGFRDSYLQSRDKDFRQEFFEDIGRLIDNYHNLSTRYQVVENALIKLEQYL